MTQRIARVTTVLFLIVALLVPPPLAIACGPDFTGPAFFSLTGPDVPYADYARGRLELLQPTYWHEPLFIAYRNLSGKPFNNAELAALGSQPPSPEQAASSQNSRQPQNWIATWESTRASLLGEKPRDLRISFDSTGVIRMSMRDQRFLQYYNCLSGAFENATRVLQSRVSQFGAQNPVIKEWIAAQDEVFENCSGDRSYPPKPKPAVLPDAARAEDPGVIRADRAYQIAAAHFYAGDFDAAQKGFEEIANDASSPYRAIAPYLAARVLIRQATLQSEEEEYDEALLAKAEVRLNAVLANKEFSEFHPAAQRLLGFIRIRLHRQERFHELETSLSAPGASKSFAQDLADYLWLLDRPVRTKTVTVAPASEGKPAQKGAAVDESSRLEPGDMTDWIFTFHESDDTAYQHSLQRWHETKSLAWLVSAIAKAPAGDKAASELSAAAEKIPANSPAFITVSFHRLRLLEQSGKSDDARQQLDQFLAPRASSLSFSAKNQFLALRMKLAANLQELLQFAPRFSNDAATYPNPPEAGAQPAQPAAVHVDTDASVILTEMLPLRLLADAAKSATLPKPLRREVVIAAWTRAILLNDDVIARELVPTAQELVPEIKDELSDYARAETSSREFAAVFSILRNPGFRPFVTAGYTRGNLYTVGEPAFNRIDDLHDNWWCPFAAASASQDDAFGRDYYRMFINLSAPLQSVYAGPRVPSPAFLTEEQRAAAAKERAVLETLPGAPNWLGQRALNWGNAHPDDPRLPEALHLVVRSWRYGCTDSNGVNYSKQAFAILHSRYADNDWTKKTQYWFE